MREVDEDGFVVRPNKSALKREQAQVRALVVALLDCPEGEWSRMGLGEPLQKEMRLARGMKASGARNRQIKFIARLLQQDGLESARQWMEQRDQHRAEEQRRIRQLEQWRERLVEEGDAALGDYLLGYPQTDRQQLRQLVRIAKKERETGKPAGAGRKLFRYLRKNEGEHHWPEH